MRIYEIDQAILELIDTETGEIMDYEAFEQLQMARDQKIENMALLLKDKAALANDIKAEIAALQARKRVAENTVARLKEYIGKALDGQKFESAKCSISYRKSESVETDMEFMEWADEFLPEVLVAQAPKLDLVGIKQKLKDGMECPYARIIEKSNVQVK